MKLLEGLIIAYILTKPFYLWASGLPQISDIILLIAFVFLLLNKDKLSELKKDFLDNKFFFIFLFFVIAINLIYSLIYSDEKFLLHTTYYIFDGIGILLFSYIFRKNQQSYKHFRIAFMVSLLMQLVIFVLKIGRVYGGIRYMGTFNDPNQFAYFCLLAYSFIYLLGKKIKEEKFNFIFLSITAFLIIESASTGMLLGLLVFVFFYLISFVKYLRQNFRKLIVLFFIGCGVFILGICCFSLTGNGKISLDLDKITIITRIEEKISKGSGKNETSLWEDRGYDRIIYYPQYLLYGAGEGQYGRFKKSNISGNELHATLPSILFCYGMVPFSFLLVWFYKKIRGVPIDILAVYAALLLESFTLINSRQVLFWVVFLIGKTIYNERYLMIKNGDGNE